MTGDITHADLVLLTAYMARTDWPADEIAIAVEKPWKYTAQLAEARMELAVDAAVPDSVVQP